MGNIYRMDGSSSGLSTEGLRQDQATGDRMNTMNSVGSNYLTNALQSRSNYMYANAGYDSSGNLYTPDKNMQAGALNKFMSMDSQFTDYLNMLKGGGQNNPFLAQGAAQNQAMYAGMGLLGTPAAASAQNQYLMDYQLKQQEQIPAMLQAQAALRQNIYGSAQKYDEYRQNVYSQEMGDLLKKYGIDMGYSGQINTTMMNADLQRELTPSFGENLAIGVASGAAGAAGSYFGTRMAGNAAYTAQ